MANLTIRLAEVPAGAMSAILHPACCGSDLAGVVFHDFTLAELARQGIKVCDSCGERILPKGVTSVDRVAAELRDLIDAKHAEHVSEVLGCAVVILRREELGHGITVPVFGMPAEFVEQAQILGLRAEAW